MASAWLKRLLLTLSLMRKLEEQPNRGLILRSSTRSLICKGNARFAPLTSQVTFSSTTVPLSVPQHWLSISDTPSQLFSPAKWSASEKKGCTRLVSSSYEILVSSRRLKRDG